MPDITWKWSITKESLSFGHILQAYCDHFALDARYANLVDHRGQPTSLEQVSISGDIARRILSAAQRCVRRPYFSSLQVPEHSAVLLVTFKPTVALYIWYCMRLIPPEPYRSTWLYEMEIDQYASLAMTYATSNMADFHIQEVINMSPLELLPEAFMPIDTFGQTNTAILQNPARDKLQPHVQMCAEFAQAVVRLNARSAHDSLMKFSIQISESTADDDIVACLRAAVLTAQMILLAHSVTEETPSEERHGLLLLMLTLLLMTADEMSTKAQAEAEAKPDVGSVFKSEVRDLVKALVQSTLTMLQTFVRIRPQELEQEKLSIFSVISLLMECQALLPMIGHEFVTQGMAAKTCIATRVASLTRICCFACKRCLCCYA